MRRRTWIGLFALVILIGLATGPAPGPDPAGAFDAAQATPAATTLEGVSSEVMARGLAIALPGAEVALGRVTIEPGASIPTHEHPGTQVAVIVSGELTYSVLVGEVPVTRGSAEAAGSAPEVVVAGESVVLRPGDSVVEQPGAIHHAHNAGTEPVVILLATLFPIGEPRTIVVEATPSTP